MPPTHTHLPALLMPLSLHPATDDDDAPPPGYEEATNQSPALSPAPTMGGAPSARQPQPGPALPCGTDDYGPGLRDAELLVWVGDFNYRWVGGWVGG